MFHFRNRLACSSCLTAAFATLSAGVAAADETRDPWKNLRGNDQGPNSAPAEREPQAASANVLETADAAYTVGQQDLNDNLDVLLDRSYGATPERDRDFIAGIDGFAGGKKWRPHVEFSVAPGNNRTMGQVNLFAPLMQDSDSLFYADLRASAWTTDVQEGNFGVGYRQIVPGAFFGSDAILGVYGFVDARHSEYNNMFYQGSLGAELITDRFEFRVNGYLPSGNQYVVGTAPGGGVTLNGRNVVYSAGNLVERALPGFDVEAGVKIDFSEAAIRLNAGYFRFERGDTLVEGPRFRAEVEIEDPFGWDGAKLSIGGEIRDDKVRGTEASGLMRLRVPIGGPGKAELADRQLSDLERLMTRRINRDEDVVAPVVRNGNAAGTGAATDALSGETLQAFFVANTAQGAADCSSVADACDFATAQGLAGAGDTFLPVDIAGVIGSVFTLNGDRQQVIGAGGSGQAIVQLSDAAGSTLIVGSLGGRPIMTGIDMGHFADSRVAGIATNGAAGISGDGMTGTIGVNDVVLNNGGIDFSNSGADIAIGDATISSGAADGVRLDSLSGNVGFSNTEIATTSGDGLSLTNNAGASIAFLNGLDIDTTTGTGLNASGGGTLSVGASGADESITSTAGQAVAMNGVDIGAGGMTFDNIASTGSAGAGISVTGAGGGTFAVSGATTISGSAGAGLALSGNSAGFDFGGATSITMTAAAAGVDVSGTNGGTIALTDLDIALQTAGATGLDLSGATLNANLTATDFDVTSTTAAGTTGVDLSGATGTGIVRLGDVDPNGASATVAGVETGIRFTAATNATLVFGDGESGADQGSSISAVTAIAGGSTVTLGSYDFDDVTFTGALDFASAGGQNLVFVGSTATGDGSGSSVGNLANAATADAITATTTTFVLVNDGAAIDDTDGFTLSDGQTMASFGNGRTFASTGLLIPANFSGVPGAGATIVDPTGNGAATLINSGSGDTLTASGTVNLQDFILSNTAGGDGLTASGATAITATGITIQNVGGQGIDLDNLTGAASTFDNTVVSTTTGNGVDIVNSNVNFTGGLNVDTTSGTGFNATGGGTVSVAATAGDESIASTSGQALNLDGVAIGGGGFNLDSVSSSGAAGSALAFTDVTGGAFAVSGATTIGLGSGAGAAGIDFAGNTTAAFTFGATTISNVGAAANQTGIDFSGATLGGSVNFDSVSISGPDTSTSSIGVNLTGVLGDQSVNLGTQANPASGPSSSITDLHRGVVIDNTAAVQFTFGDGESGSDRGSSIDVNGQAGAFTVDAGGGTLAASSFDFNDVAFGAGDTANLPTGNAPVFVSFGGGLVTAGTNNISQDVTTITVVDAETLADTDQTFVFVGGAGGTLDLAGGGVDGFTLEAGQSVVSFNDGNSIPLGVTQPVNLEGNFGIAGVTSDDVTVGNSTVGATSVINASAGGNNTIGSLDIFDIPAGATGILIDGNTAGVTVTNVGITGISGTGTGVSIQGAQAAIGLNNVDIVATATGIDNQLGTAAGDVTVDAASSITNTTTIAVNLDQNASDFGFAGTISETDGAGAGIAANQQGGAVSFSGSVALNTGTSNAVALTANTGSVSFGDTLNIDTTSGTGFSATGGGTVSVAATAGDQSISTTSGQALNLNGMAIGAGGLNFDTVQVSTGGAADGIGIDTVNTAAGGIAIGSATLAGHTGTAIDLDAISGAGGFSLVSADIDLGAGGVGVDIGGANGTISIGTGTSNAIMGLNVDGGSRGIRIAQTAGTVNLGTSATGVVQIGATTRPTQQALRINVDSAGTINVGNTTNQSRLDANLNGIFSAFADATTTFTNVRAGSSAAATVLINDNDAAGETNFTGGLQVESTGGGGIVLDTAQVSVASAPGLNSLTASGGGVGFVLSGTTIGAAGLHFDTVDLAGTATGINISGGVTGGDIVLGNVDVNTAVGGGVTRGIAISDAFDNNLTVADFDATLQQDDIGLQVIGALGGTISFGDFDIVSASTTGTVGIDIEGATGGSIRIGDTNTNGGSQITLGSGANPLAIGVRVDGTTDTTFTIGDGDGTSGDLTASDIHATTAISGTLPGTGTYNFRDIDFNASGIANISGGASFFVFDEEGTSGAGTLADPGTAAEAAAAGVNVLVAIDNSGVIGNVIDLSSAGQGSINTLSLDDNQALISLLNGQSIDVTTLISGLGAAAPASFQFTNVGGTTTITGSGVAGVSRARITTTGANNTVSLAGSAGIRSVNIYNDGTGDAIFASYGAAENVIIRSSVIGSAGGDAIDIATTAGASTFDFSDLTMISGLRLDGTGGGSLTGTATGTNTIASAVGTGLYLDTVVIGAGGFSSDSVNSTNAGNGNSGIRLDTLSGAGAVTIANATIVDSGGAGGGHAIELTNIGTTGALTIANIDIDMPTTGGNNLRGILSNGGHTSDINLGTGAGGVDIRDAGLGLQFIGTAGVVNVGTGAGSGGVQLVTLGNGFNFGSDSTGTFNVGNTSTASSFSTSLNTTAISFNLSDATVTMTGIDINSAGTTGSDYGILVFDDDGVGSFTLAGTNTIDNTGDHGIQITNASADISNVTFGASATGTADDISGAGIFIENTDGTSRTVNLSNITMGSGGNGDTADVAGAGIDINSSGAGVLTVNLTGTNVIRSTGQALDVDETNGVATANNVLLSIDNTTFESGSAGQTVEITGQNDSGTTSSVGMRSFSNNTVIGNGTAGGILFTNVDFDSDGGGAQLAGGTLDIGQGTGNRVVGDGLSLINPTGDLGFTTLNIFNDNGTGLEVNTKGATTTFNLDNAGGTVDTTNGTALFLDPLTMNLVFATVNSTGADDGGGFDSGVFIEEGDASGGAGGVALDIGTLNITGSAGAGLVIENSTGTFNFGATTIDNTGTGGGGVYFDATAALPGDTLNVNFTGGLDIDTTSGTGFEANVFVSSTFNLQVANAGAETINTTTGRVLDLLNTSASGAGINFDSLTASDTVNGDAIELDIEAGTFNGGDVVIAGTAGGNDSGISLGQGKPGAVINFASATMDDVGGYAIESVFDGTATFTTVDIDGGSRAIYVGGTGGLNINGGSIGASTSTSGRSIHIDLGSGDVNIAATVTKTTAGELVLVRARTGGTVTLSGNLSATGAATGIIVGDNTGGTVTFSGATQTLNTGANAAVSLTNNTGATVNFTGGGLDIDTTSGTGFTATGGGTVNVSGAGNTIASSGGAAVDMQNVTIGGSGATFASISSGGGTNGILLQHVDGAFTVAGTAALNNSASAGLNLFNSNVGNDGNLTFTANTLNISNASGGGAFVQRGTGTGRTDFDVTTGTINSGSRTPIFISNSGNATIDLGATFASVSMNGSANGIFIQNSLATGTISGSLNTGSGGTIQNTGANAVNMNRLSASVTIGQAITTASGGIRVTNQVSGTNTFSGVHNLTGAGSGYLFDSNAGGATNITGNVTASTLNGAALTINTSAAHTVTFSGTNTSLTTTSGNTVDISAGATVNFNSSGTNTITATTTGKGIEANGGGTVVIGGTASVTSATGTAVDIQNTTIGAAGITLESVSTNGASNAINLRNTGSSGFFSITGTGSTDGSGGLIQNITGADMADETPTASGQGAAIYLENVSDIRIANLQVQNTSNFGLRGFDVDGVTMNNVDFTGSHGDNAGPDEGVFYVNNLTGTATFTGGTYLGGIEDSINIDNDGTTGTLTLAMTGMSITTGDGVDASLLGNGITIQASAGNVNGTISSNNFIAATTTHLQLASSGTANFALTVDNNTFTRHSGIVGNGGIGISANTQSSGLFDVTISNNNMETLGSLNNAIDVGSVNGAGIFAGTVDMTISGNTIGTNGVNGSGTDVTAIDVDGDGGGSSIYRITGNRIFDHNFYGIRVKAGEGAGSSHQMSVLIDDNLVQDTATGIEFDGILVDSGVSSGTTPTICATVTNNTVTGNHYFGHGIRVRGRNNGTLQIANGVGGGVSEGAIEAHLGGAANNTVAQTINATLSGTGAHTFVVACPN
ncbi:MAG: inverse autotransporter beta domain-containing protein [Hoeflea sp.]|uniref:inverse autotransporter beta domain-containing protein n=1 Tax=Hoeflea sp. TaxID=1940281 RepID=UPI0032EB0AF9